MCENNPFCSIPPVIGLINMAANHVEVQHHVEVTSAARQVLAQRIESATGSNPEKLKDYLGKRGLSHVDLVQMAERQFLQGLPHVPAKKPGRPSPKLLQLDAPAVETGIEQKAWSPLWTSENR